MSELDRVLKEYRRDSQTEWIERKEAAQLLNITHQRLDQYVKEGRIRAKHRRGRRGRSNPVAKEDIINFTRKAGSRTRSKEPKHIYTKKHGFKLYQQVVYEHSTDLGYSAPIPAKVVRLARAKVLISLTTKNGTERKLWVKPELLRAKQSRGENTMLFVQYKSPDGRDAFTICTPYQWARYLRNWQKLFAQDEWKDDVSAEAKYNWFRSQFETKSMSQNMAAQITRLFGGRQFGKFPEYTEDKFA